MSRPRLPFISPPRRAELTERERQVLELVARGQGNPSIAAQLEIAESTLRTHIQRLYRKTFATTDRDLVVKAIRMTQP